MATRLGFGNATMPNKTPSHVSENSNPNIPFSSPPPPLKPTPSSAAKSKKTPLPKTPRCSIPPTPVASTCSKKATKKEKWWPPRRSDCRKPEFENELEMTRRSGGRGSSRRGGVGGRGDGGRVEGGDEEEGNEKVEKEVVEEVMALGGDWVVGTGEIGVVVRFEEVGLGGGDEVVEVVGEHGGEGFGAGEGGAIGDGGEEEEDVGVEKPSELGHKGLETVWWKWRRRWKRGGRRGSNGQRRREQWEQRRQWRSKPPLLPTTASSS